MISSIAPGSYNFQSEEDHAAQTFRPWHSTGQSDGCGRGEEAFERFQQRESNAELQIVVAWQEGGTWCASMDHPGTNSEGWVAGGPSRWFSAFGEPVSQLEEGHRVVQICWMAKCFQVATGCETGAPEALGWHRCLHPPAYHPKWTMSLDFVGSFWLGFLHIYIYVYICIYTYINTCAYETLQ